MIEKYTKSFILQFSETDFSFALKLHALVNRMQEVSSLHAEELGMGYEALAEHQLGWIISRYKISMKRYPTWREKITIETWPSGLDKLFAMRSFRIYDEANEQIGNIYSAYMLISSETGRLQRMSALPIELPVIEDDENIEELKKIRMPSQIHSTYVRRVHYTNIDLNMHMNNAYYVQWIEDCFELEQYKEMQVNNLQVNFISGAKLGEEVVITVYVDDQCPHDYYIQGKEEKSQREIFQAKVEWKPKL